MPNLSLTDRSSSSLPQPLPSFRARSNDAPKLEVCEPPTPEPVVETSLADRLGELAKDASVEHAVEIGRLVIERLYGGDLSTWRSRGPKAHSLRELARRSDLPISSSALYRSIALFELGQRLGGVSRWSSRGLGISHMRLVLGLPADEQHRLLDMAVDQSWTVAELERETVLVRENQPRKKARGGRPRLPRFVKSINKLRKCVQDSGEFFGDLDAAAEMKPDKVHALREQLAEVRRRCDELEAAIARAGD